MDPRTYQLTALSTAIYPQQGANLGYPALGLCGESAEVLDKVLRLAEASEIEAEVGDVLWYVAVLAFEAGIGMDAIAWRWPTPLPPARLEAASQLVVAAGRCAEVVKKSIRDGSGQLDGVRAQRLIAALRDVLEHAGAVAPYGLDRAAEENVRKLADRAGRSMLHGDGDRR